MFRPLTLYIGMRYTRAKKRSRFVSFISVVSMLGIILGVWALIVIMSVMNGFEKELHQRVLGMVSHATVTATQGDLDHWEAVMDTARDHPEVVGAAPFIQRETMLRAYRVSGAIVRGIVPKLEVSVAAVADKMLVGHLDDLQAGRFGIVLGAYLARVLDVGLGDKVTVFAPLIRVTPAGPVPQLKRFTVVGIFSVGMNEYDGGMALIHLHDAARLFRLSQGVSGVRVKMQDLLRAAPVARDLAERLGQPHQVSDWTQEHASWFRAIQIEKTAMFVIVSLIIAVAAFNIISTLVMVVTDKQADIAILRTLGLSPAKVMGIFMVLGLIIGVIGTGIGVSIGVITALNVEQIVSWLEQTLGFRIFSSDIYLISNLPSDMHWSDVIKVGGLALTLTVLATLYPARRAASTAPAEALRYE